MIGAVDQATNQVSIAELQPDCHSQLELHFGRGSERLMQIGNEGAVALPLRSLDNVRTDRQSGATDLSC